MAETKDQIEDLKAEVDDLVSGADGCEEAAELDDDLFDVSDLDDADLGEDEAGDEGASIVFDLRLTTDRVAVVVDFVDPGDNVRSILYRIEQGLEKLDLVYVPPKEQIEAWLNAALEAGPPFINLRLLEGESPIDALDGRIEWGAEYFASGFVADTAHSVNYMERAEKLSVHKGDLVATVHPPVEGTPGYDLFDEAIPVPAPERVSLSSGQNVTKTENEDGTVSFHAEIDGRLRWVSDIVSVDDVFAVKGDVGLETGNIHHSGALLVGGDIKSGSKVEVEGDIHVKGMVEPCDIVCGGSLDVEGGIIGSDEHSIVVKGAIAAKYVSDAVIEAGGDVVVHNEILNTRLRTLGAVEIPEGRIIGGKTSAHVEIVVGQAGSEARVPTKLICGIDHLLPERLTIPKEKVKACEEALTKLNGFIAQATEAKKPVPEAVFDEMMQRQHLIEGELIKWQDKIDRIIARSQARSKGTIIVTEEIHPEVLFKIREGKKLAKRYIQSARRATCRQGDLRLQPLAFKS